MSAHYKSGCGGNDFDRYTLADERRFLSHLGTLVLGSLRPGWDRLRYLKSYRAAIEERTKWSASLNRREVLELADAAIQAELDRQQPARGVAHVGNRDWMVRHHVNAERSAT